MWLAVGSKHCFLCASGCLSDPGQIYYPFLISMPCQSEKTVFQTASFAFSPLFQTASLFKNHDFTGIFFRKHPNTNRANLPEQNSISVESQ